MERLCCRQVSVSLPPSLAHSLVLVCSLCLHSFLIALCFPICISSSLPHWPAFPQPGLSLPLLPSPLFLPRLWLCLPPCLTLPITGLSLPRPSWTSCTRQGSCIPCLPGWSCTQRSALMSALPTCWASRVRQLGSPTLAWLPALLAFLHPYSWVLSLTLPLGLGKLPPARPPSLPPPQAPPLWTCSSSMWRS